MLSYPEDWEKIVQSFDFIEPEMRESLLCALIVILARG